MRHKREILIALIALTLFGLPLLNSEATEIKMGAIFGFTGVNSTVQTLISYGYGDYMKWVNDHGGINGTKIKYIPVDDGYTVPGFLKQYWNLKNQGCVTLQSEQTGGGDAVRKHADRDHFPITTMSLTDYQLSPPGLIYGTAIQYADAFLATVDWALKAHKEKRPLRICWMTHDNPFGRAPVDKTTKYAKERGVEVFGPVYIPSAPTNITAELKTVEKYHPDYVFMNLGDALVGVMSNVQRLGLQHHKMRFVNHWIFTPAIKAAPEACTESLLFNSAVGVWGEDTPGMRMIYKMAEKYRAGTKFSKPLYIVGVNAAMASVGALELALEKVSPDKLTREDYKKYGLDRMQNYDMKGTSGPITFTPTQRRGVKFTRILRVKDGKTVAPLTKYWIPVPKLPDN